MLIGVFFVPAIGQAQTTSTTSSTANSGPQAATDVFTPQLSTDIPGLTFTQVMTEDGILEINFLGDYISGVYNYLIGFSTTIAIVFIMIAGLQYSFGGASAGTVSKAKERIRNAVIGLSLLLGTVTILTFINPKTTLFKPLRLQTVSKLALEDVITMAVESCKDLHGSVDPCSVQTLKTPSGWSDSLTDTVNAVAQAEGVDPILIATHLQKETGGTINYSASERGPCGEIGIAQFMPTTFESIVGQECCTVVAAKSSGTRGRYEQICDNGSVDWPPDTGTIPDCNTSICGNCQVAQTSCAEYFDTSKTNGIQNTVTAAARLIRYNLNASRIGGDIAMAMCAYNGSGAQAAAYAQSAASIYQSFCANSGGTN